MDVGFCVNFVTSLVSSKKPPPRLGLLSAMRAQMGEQYPPGRSASIKGGEMGSDIASLLGDSPGSLSKTDASLLDLFRSKTTVCPLSGNCLLLYSKSIVQCSPSSLISSNVLSCTAGTVTGIAADVVAVFISSAALILHTKRGLIFDLR